MGIGDFNETTITSNFDEDQQYMADEASMDEMAYIEAQQAGVTGRALDSFGYDIDVTEESIPIKFTASPDNPFQYQIWLWLKSIRDKLGGARSWASRNLIQREFERALNQYIEQSGADKVTIDRSEYEYLLSLQRQYGKATHQSTYRGDGIPNPMTRMTTQSNLFRQRRLDSSRAPTSEMRDEIPYNEEEGKKEKNDSGYSDVGRNKTAAKKKYGQSKNHGPEESLHEGVKESRPPTVGDLGGDLDSGDLADIISKSSW